MWNECIRRRKDTIGMLINVDIGRMLGVNLEERTMHLSSMQKWLLKMSCMWYLFLALLDYVSRAHEIEIRPSSVVRPSVRPSVASIFSEVTAWIPFKFQFWLPLGHMPRHFFSFLKKIFF